jgi:hypothetical protein
LGLEAQLKVSAEHPKIKRTLIVVYHGQKQRAYLKVKDLPPQKRRKKKKKEGSKGKTVVKNTKAAVVRASTGGFAVRGRGAMIPTKKTRCVVK